MRFLIWILTITVVQTSRIEREHEPDEPISENVNLEGNRSLGTLSAHNDQIETENKDLVTGNGGDAQREHDDDVTGDDVTGENSEELEHQEEGDDAKVVSFSTEEIQDGRAADASPDGDDAPLDDDLSDSASDEISEQGSPVQDSPDEDSPVELPVEQPNGQPEERDGTALESTDSEKETLPDESSDDVISNDNENKESVEENKESGPIDPNIISNITSTTKTPTSTVISSMQTTSTTQTASTTSTTLLVTSTSTKDYAYQEEIEELKPTAESPNTKPSETKIEVNTRGRGTVVFFLLLVCGATMFFIFRWRMNRRNDTNRYISTAATFNNPVSFPDMNYHDDPL